MPKRSSSKQVASDEATSERKEAVTRATESSPVLESGGRRIAEPVAAGPEKEAATGPSITRAQNALPLLRADTREKLLYKVACYGTPLGSDFFDQFPDVQEILTLSLSISVRLLIVAICNSEMATTQRISAMRLVAALNGKQLPGEDEQPAKPPTQAAVDASSAIRSIDKIRALASGDT
jgi:hypothetical protein